MMTERRAPNLPCLTGLRGVAALIVVVYHYLQAPSLVTGTIVSPFAGYLGVDLFFILSGFLMALNYGSAFDRRFGLAAYWDFLGKRIARVYPLYAFVTMVVFVLSFWNIFQAHVRLRVVVINLALAQQLGPGWIRPYLGDSILGGAWSISTELGAYLLFPLLYRVACRSGRGAGIAALALAVAAIALLVWLPPSLTVQQLPKQGPLDLWSGWSAWPLIRCLADFTIGLWLWRFVTDHPHAALGRDSAGPVLALAAVALLFVRGADFVAVVVIAALIGHLSFERSRLAAWLGTAPMIWLGEVSYAVYILHVSLIAFTFEHPQGIFAHPAFHDHYPLVLATTLLMLFVLSRLLFLHVERPARRWMRALFAIPVRRPIGEEPAAP